MKILKFQEVSLTKILVYSILITVVVSQFQIHNVEEKIKIATTVDTSKIDKDTTIAVIIKTLIINEIKRREGFSENVYSYRGHYYIGYGYQLDETSTLTITEEEGSLLLIDEFNRHVKLVENFYKIEDGRKYILASLSYNIGFSKLINSNLNKLIVNNENDTIIANYILKFNKVTYNNITKVSTNLQYSRNLEQQLYKLASYERIMGL